MKLFSFKKVAFVFLFFCFFTYFIGVNADWWVALVFSILSVLSSLVYAYFQNQKWCRELEGELRVYSHRCGCFPLEGSVNSELFWRNLSCFSRVVFDEEGIKIRLKEAVTIPWENIHIVKKKNDPRLAHLSVRLNNVSGGYLDIYVATIHFWGNVPNGKK